MKKNKCDDCLIGLYHLPYECDVCYESFLDILGFGLPDVSFNYCPHCRS